MGVTVFDAGVLIGFLDRDDSHHESSHRAIAAADTRNDQLVIPASALAEALVGPSRAGAAAVATVRALVDRLPLHVEPLDLESAVIAAALRARHRTLKLPDALVIATAERLAADRLVTTDHGWPSRSKLKISVAIDKI